MNNELIITIISTVITAVVLPLITLAGNKLIVWLGAKLKNEKAAYYLTQATTITTNAVRSVFQTYVDSLKKSGGFDAEAQQTALAKCKGIVIAQLTDELKDFLNAAYGDFNTWLNTQIESTISALKTEN